MENRAQFIMRRNADGGAYFVRFVGYSYCDAAGEYGAVYNDVRRARSTMADLNFEADADLYQLCAVYSDNSVRVLA